MMVIIPGAQINVSSSQPHVSLTSWNMFCLCFNKVHENCLLLLRGLDTLLVSMVKCNDCIMPCILVKTFLAVYVIRSICSAAHMLIMLYNYRDRSSPPLC